MLFVARCFPAEISKTGRYTNVVCCEVKILHSEQNPGPSAAPNSFWGELRSFFLSCFYLVFFGFVVIVSLAPPRS